MCGIIGLIIFIRTVSLISYIVDLNFVTVEVKNLIGGYFNGFIGRVTELHTTILVKYEILVIGIGRSEFFSDIARTAAEI